MKHTITLLTMLVSFGFCLGQKKVCKKGTILLGMESFESEKAEDNKRDTKKFSLEEAYQCLFAQEYQFDKKGMAVVLRDDQQEIVSFRHTDFKSKESTSLKIINGNVFKIQDVKSENQSFTKKEFTQSDSRVHVQRLGFQSDQIYELNEREKRGQYYTYYLTSDLPGIPNSDFEDIGFPLKEVIRFYTPTDEKTETHVAVQYFQKKIDRCLFKLIHKDVETISREKFRELQEQE